MDRDTCTNLVASYIFIANKLTMDNTETRYDCTSPADQLAIANNHKITEAKFNTMVSAFFGASVPSPTIIDWAEVNGLIENADCTNMRLRFHMDENDVNANNITMELVEMLETYRYYSIPLFKGIKQLMDVQEFHFYKAKNAANQYDIVFKAVSGGSSMHFDLSDLHP